MLFFKTWKQILFLFFNLFLLMDVSAICKSKTTPNLENRAQIVTIKSSVYELFVCF